jgi:hypothetical protein
MAHGSTFTQLPLTQPLMAPPQNNSHKYLVDEIINNPLNNQVPPLRFQPQIQLVNTPIIPQVPHLHINLNPQFHIEDSATSFPISPSSQAHN